jgi:hypothetical protein
MRRAAETIGATIAATIAAAMGDTGAKGNVVPMKRGS